MLLPGALFILFLAGCWLLCLTDVATTPAAEFPGLSKRGWIALIAVTFTVGAVAWYATRTRRRLRCWPQILASHVTMGSYRYGIVNVGAGSLIDLFAIYNDACDKLPFRFE